jgi:glycosyltransferase involved in cell wall biosynthesis
VKDLTSTGKISATPRAFADPLVSIIVISYNYAAYVGAAIRSAIEQTYTNLEILVLDNASTDASVEVIRSFEDPRIRLVVHRENIGMKANHAAGIAMVRGEFLLFLSADDMLFPTAVDEILTYRRNHPSVDVVYASAAYVDKDGRYTGTFSHPAFHDAYWYEGRNDFVNLLTRDNFVMFPTVLFPKSFFEELGGLDEELSIVLDYEFAIRMASAEKRMAYLAKPLAIIRSHGENRSGVRNFVGSGDQLREFCTILSRYTRPEFHERLCGYRVELDKMIDAKVREMASQFPEAFASMRNVLQPYVDRARENVAAVPAMSAACRSGTPLVSVIVPFHGRLERLGSALTSLISQEYTHWEAVVISDATLDPKPLIDRMELASKVQAGVYPAAGPGVARNRGLLGANGEIIAYLDEDNEFAEGYLSALARAFADPNTNVTQSWAELNVVGAGGDTLLEVELDETSPGASRVTNNVALNAVAHRRSRLSKTGYFHPGFSVLEDWEFLLRLNARSAFTRLGHPACRIGIERGLNGHHLFGRRDSAQWNEYAARLQDIYRAYAVPSDAELGERRKYVAALQDVIQRGVNNGGHPKLVADFVMSIAGFKERAGVSA